jgi:hypothetical protein
VTRIQLVEKLRKMQEKEGSQYALSITLGVDAPTLSSVIRGRRDPSERLLKALGMEEVKTYRMVSE